MGKSGLDIALAHAEALEANNERLCALLREARRWFIPLNSVNDKNNLAARIDAALAGTAVQPSTVSASTKDEGIST